MRRRLPLIIAAMVVVLAAVLTVAFSAGAAGPERLTSAEDVLQAARQADKDVTTGVFNYRVTVTAKGVEDAGSAAVFLDRPIIITGTARLDSEARVADLTMRLSAGNGSYTTEAALRWIGDKGWVQFAGAWYELPQKALDKVAEAEAKAEHGQSDDKAALKALGLNPQEWLDGLSLDVEELDGADVYRVSTGFDVAAIAGDVIAAVQKPGFREIVAEHLDAEEMAEFDAKLEQIQSDGKLAEAPGMAAAVVRQPRAEVWVDTATHQVRKLSGSVTVVPPTEAGDSAPFESLSVAVTVTADALGEPVQVQAPADPRPWSDLEQMFGSHASGSGSGAAMRL